MNKDDTTLGIVSYCFINVVELLAIGRNQDLQILLELLLRVHRLFV